MGLTIKLWIKVFICCCKILVAGCFNSNSRQSLCSHSELLLADEPIVLVPGVILGVPSETIVQFQTNHHQFCLTRILHQSSCAGRDCRPAPCHPWSHWRPLGFLQEKHYPPIYCTFLSRSLLHLSSPSCQTYDLCCTLWIFFQGIFCTLLHIPLWGIQWKLIFLFFSSSVKVFSELFC